jgi:hypothetical protein
MVVFRVGACAGVAQQGEVHRRLARVEITEFSDKQSSRIFIAGSLREAERAEKLLTENAISYTIEIEEFVKPGLFSSGVMEGVAFYVLSSQRDLCKVLFYDNGPFEGMDRSRLVRSLLPRTHSSGWLTTIARLDDRPVSDAINRLWIRVILWLIFKKSFVRVARSGLLHLYAYCLM